MKTYGVLVSSIFRNPEMVSEARCELRLQNHGKATITQHTLWYLNLAGIPWKSPRKRRCYTWEKTHTKKKTWRNLYARQGFSVAMVFRWRVIFIPTAHNIFPPPTPGRPLPKVSVVEAAFLNQCMAPAPSKTRRCCDLIRCWTESEHLQYSKNVQYKCVVSWHGGFLK